MPCAIRTHWLTPVGSNEKETPEEVIRRLVGKAKVYGFSERTPGRKHLKPGDRICFYASGSGVVAHAEVASAPKKEHHAAIHNQEKYEWVFRLTKTRLYLEKPVVIDGALRSQLDAFAGRDLHKSWAWFVQATRKITERDFHTLTR